MDENLLNRDEVHDVNVLTVIANESYENFTKSLQSELSKAVADRPHKVEAALFYSKFDDKTALAVYENLVEYGYVKNGALTEKYYQE